MAVVDCTVITDADLQATCYEGQGAGKGAGLFASVWGKVLGAALVDFLPLILIVILIGLIVYHVRTMSFRSWFGANRRRY